MPNQNITAGRLREYVEFKKTSTEKDENNEIIGGDVLVFDCRADVDIKSAAQNADYGTVVTTEVITVLTWFNALATNDQTIHWDNKKYIIQGVVPSKSRRSMIVTAFSEET